MHVWTNITVNNYHSMHGGGMVHINSDMEQECIDKCTVNNYLGSTKFLQLQIQLLFISSLVMTVDLLLAPSQATAVDMPKS